MVGYMDREREKERGRETQKKTNLQSLRCLKFVWLGSASMRCAGSGKICIALMVQGKNGIRFGFWSAGTVCLIH